uniref:Uncharacterized protein n=1 Tax=Oryza brachyantha TaxID=4533 RepID=J3LY30_ORYBR
IGFMSALTAQFSSLMDVFLLMSCWRHPSPTCSFIPLDCSYYHQFWHILALASCREFSEVVVKYKERHLWMKPLKFLAFYAHICKLL